MILSGGGCTICAGFSDVVVMPPLLLVVAVVAFVVLMLDVTRPVLGVLLLLFGTFNKIGFPIIIIYKVYKMFNF